MPGGTNTLRANGPRSFGTKTLLGNWYDERKVPGVEAARPEAGRTETEIRAGETWRGGASLPFYGASLASTAQLLRGRSVEDELDYNNVINPYRFFVPSGFQSISKTVHHSGRGGSSEFKSTAALAQSALTRDPGALAEYRARWINEGNDLTRERRFRSEMVRALEISVPAKLRVLPARFLPGLPKSMETLRDKAIDALGMDAVLRLAVLLPPSFTLLQLRSTLEGVGVKLSVDQSNEIWREICPDAASDILGYCKADSEVLINALMAHPLSNSRMDAIIRAWTVLLEIGHGQVTLGTVKRVYDPVFHPQARGGKISSAAATARVVAGLATISALHAAIEKDEATATLCGVQVSVDGGRDGCDFAAAAPSAPVPFTSTSPLTYNAFEHWAAFISAAVELDDVFARLFDTGFHITAAPNTAEEAAARTMTVAPADRASSPPRSPPRSPGREQGTLRGAALAMSRAQTTYSEIGAGLKLLADGGGSKVKAVQATAESRRASRFDETSAMKAAGGTHITVLVTHTDGSKSMQKVPTDRFLVPGDVDGLRERLARLGVSDVAAVSTDF